MSQSTCPQCQGVNFSKPHDHHANNNGIQLDYLHLLCLNCMIVLWVPALGHYPSLGFCGSPQEHFFDHADVAALLPRRRLV